MTREEANYKMIIRQQYDNKNMNSYTLYWQEVIQFIQNCIIHHPPQYSHAKWNIYKWKESPDTADDAYSYQLCVQYAGVIKLVTRSLTVQYTGLIKPCNPTFCTLTRVLTIPESRLIQFEPISLHISSDI